MKILAYTQYLGKKTINFIHNEILSLDQQFDVLVVSHFISSENPIGVKQLKKIRHYENRIQGKVIRLIKKIGVQIPSFESEFADIVNSFNPQIIHIHFGNIAERVLDYFNRTDIPIIISFHGHDASKKLTNKNYIKRLNNLFLRPNIHPIFVSKFMLKNIQKAGIRFKDYNILYYGTNTSRFKRRTKNLPKSPYTFLQVSSFVEKKGHVVTLKAYRKFLDTSPKLNSQLVFGGGGSGIEDIQKLCKELNLEDYVSFKGWVDVDGAIELMDNAHAFLHHSIIAKNNDMEGIPNAIMEAMSMELPVISTVHSGIPELIENEINGFLVKEHDINTYAQRMHDILDWNYLPINRKKIAQKFERNAHNEQLIKIYQKYL